jgi:hypothetical protein
VLKFTAEEARGLNHHHIGTEHLLLGLLREKNCFGAQILQQGGAELAKLRRQIEKLPEQPWPAVSKYELRGRNVSAAFKDTIEIHGAPWNTEYVHDAYKKCREYNWHWQKAPWTPHDLIINRKEATISFDLRLADDAENFHLVKGGWKKDHCTICRWELFASPDSPAHGVGYTNGRDWLCAECYEKFFAQNFFFSAYPTSLDQIERLPMKTRHASAFLRPPPAHRRRRLPAASPRGLSEDVSRASPQQNNPCPTSSPVLFLLPLRPAHA